MKRELLISVSPFFISFILELGSPFVGKYWKEELRSNAERLEEDSYISSDITDHFVDFADHALGSVQMLYAFIITFVAGCVQLFFQRILGVVGILVLLGIVLYLSYLLYTGDPYDFATKSEKWRYSPAAVFGMLINILFIIIILIG